MITGAERGGPDARHSVASAPNRGFTTLRAVGYTFARSGTQNVSGEFPGVVGARIESGWDLRYVLFPEWADARDVRDGFAADAVIVDLVFDDGSRLSDLGLLDEVGSGFTSVAQHLGAALQPDQWNIVRVRLDPAAGRTVAHVELVFAETRETDDWVGAEQPDLPAVRGWLDEVAVVPSAQTPERPVERARTRQGTLSSRTLSRGNSVPAVTLPNGFVSGIPVTRADDAHWPYSWHIDNRSDNRPAIEAFATSHLASPWMAEHGAFQVMPALPAPGRAVPTAPRDRARGFSHDDEVGHPHVYRVTLDEGITAELTAAEHAVLARFRVPGDEGILIFDQVAGFGELFLPRPSSDLSGAAVVTAYTDDQHGGADRGRAPRSFLHAELDRPIVDAGMSARRHPDGIAAPVRGWVRVALGEDRTVVVRLATSAIGTRQAARNLHLDGADDPFDEVCERAADAWDDWIGRIELGGGAPEHQAMMATALYRVGMFPRRCHENLGTVAVPEPHYASPFGGGRAATATEAGVPVRPGELSVDQGFWDVYRTAWPLYLLIGQDRAGRLLDGFAEHFRAGGWTSRWSAPGPVDSMTGTSSDIVFAHAVDAGVTLDLWAAYESALRNATVRSADARVGRKGLETSAFRVWVSTDVPEGLTWTLDGATNDLAVARLAAALTARMPSHHPRAAELRASETYFLLRAGRHAIVFDPRVGFYLGRGADGAFRLDPDEFDPAIWGFDYTETNGWGTAFSAPHDGEGLASVHGGREALADRLEEYFQVPETGADAVRGSYSEVIHEMTEARNLRFGQGAPSNQPAHHVPYMALFAGRPDIAQRHVHEAASRLFSGGEIGQGWPGDEDNGEMSAWWIFAALGIYPLVPGTAGYALTAPLFARSRVHVGNGRFLTIEAPGASRAQPYVRSVTLDGEPWSSTFVPHERIAHGGVLRIEVSEHPEAWGAAPADAPPSLTAAGALPSLPYDLTADAVVTGPRRDARLLVDDDASSGAVPLAAGDVISFEWPEPVCPELLTVTPLRAGEVAFAVDAVHENGDIDTASWVEPFPWAGQTRPFLLAERGLTRPARRWRWTATMPVIIAQLEMLVARTWEDRVCPINGGSGRAHG